MLKYFTAYDEKQAQRRKEIESQPIFKTSKSPVSSKTGSEAIKLVSVNNKHSAFSNEAITYRTLRESQKLLGIRQRNKKNNANREKTAMSPRAEEMCNVRDCGERLVNSESIKTNPEDPGCERGTDNVGTKTSTSAGMSGLNLVNIYEDSDSESDTNVT